MPPWRATHKLSYAAIAETLGIRRCRGINDAGQRCFEDHEGTVAGGFLHWADRRITRAGIKRFLHLASTMVVTNEPGPVWAVTFARYRWVAEQLRNLGFRYPRSAWTTERARLRAMLAKAPKHPDESELRTEAMAWSRG